MSIQLLNSNEIIKSLHLQGAVVHFLPANISQTFPNLKILKIINSSLSEIEKSDFMGLEKVVEINFEKNLISKLPVDAFQWLEGLTKINLNRNNISAIPAKLFNKNLKLTEISLVGNRIEQLHDQIFKNLVNLEFIFLSDNNIEDLRGGTFDDCTELQVITINNNKLKFAPKSIFDRNQKLTFSRKNFLKNKCIDSFLESNALNTFEDLMDAFAESCKPYNQEYIDELIDKIKMLERKSEKCESENSKLDKEFNKLSDELRTKKEQLEILEEEKTTFESKLTSKDEKISELNDKVEELTKDVKNLTSNNTKCQIDLKNQETLNTDLEAELKTCKDLSQDCLEIKDNTLRKLGSESLKIHKFETINQNLTAELDKLRTKVTEQDQIIANITKDIEASATKLRISDMTNLFLLNGYNEANQTIKALSTKSCRSKSLTPIAEPENVNFYNIACKFEETDIRNDKFYTCGVNDVRALDCGAKLKEISTNSNGKTVTGISFTDSQLIDFPFDLTKKFENFKYFKITKSVFGKFVENICELSSEIEVLSVTSSTIGESITLDNCKALKTLQIDASGIKSISSSNPIKSLSNIALKSNKIEEISMEFFSKFENLKSVQMSENKISFLNGNIFDGNKLLETVNLSKNPIKKINGEIFTQNTKLANVDFKQLECISKAEYNKNKIRDLRDEILSKCR